MTIYLSAPIYLEEKYYKNLIKNNTYIIDDYAFDIFKYTKELFSNQINIKQKTILDVGCNIGTFSFLAQEMGAKYVTGFDIDSIFIKLCFLTQVDLNKHIIFY